MRTSIKLLVAALILAVALGIIGYKTFFNAADISQSSSPSVQLTEKNMAAYLKSTNLVSDIPSSGNVLIKTPDASYTLTKGQVQEGEIGNADIVITTSSSYLYGDSNKLCTRLTNALKKGELSTELKISKASALFRYSSIMKYKSCLGL